MKYFCIIYFILYLQSELALATLGRRIGSLIHTHSTVGTTAQDAISAGSINAKIVGWLICHDAGSAPTYLAISNGADPDTDGIRVGPGSCFECLDCGAKALENANVKGQAASAGYSVIQLK